MVDKESSEERGGFGTMPDYLRIKKTVRVAVSGDVHLTELEIRIVDHPHFQRLRGVVQLGMASLVFPSALHTRFEHSLGVLGMLARMIRAIGENTHNRFPEECEITPEQEVLARLYALLHDITHVPFGHTIEDELGLFTRHDKNVARIAHFIGSASPIGKMIAEALGPDIYERFSAIYQWDGKTPLPHGDEFIYDLVSNTVCADLLDYLARDNYCCNLDLINTEYRFLNFLYLDRDANDRRRPFIRLRKVGRQPREDTLLDLCRLMDARYRLAERVYFHHAKIVAGGMLGRALHDAVAVGDVKETDLYEHSDESLLRALEQSSSPVAETLGRALRERRLHKLLRTYSAIDFEAVQAENHEANAVDRALARVGEPAARCEFEDETAAQIGADPGEVIVYALPEDETNFKYADVNILWEGKPALLRNIRHKARERLDLAINGHKRLWGIRILVSPRIARNEKLRALVREKCDIAFVTPVHEVAEREHSYYKKLVQLKLTEEDAEIPTKIREYGQKVNRAADYLKQTAKDRRSSWSKRLDAAIRKSGFGSGE